MTAMSTRTMRAYVLTGPGEGEVQEVPVPVAAPGEVVVDVERVGVCGTDVEFFTGEMAYLHQGYASYPIRLGHEWAGTVASVGTEVEPAWVGRRVMGDTMLGDGTCRRCRRGYQHVCENRQEVGVRGGRPGALAERSQYRSPRYTPFPTRSTQCSVRWWNRVATVFVPRRLRPLRLATGHSCSVREPLGCWSLCSRALPAPRCI